MTIAVVTGSRADWNGLGMVAKRLRDDHKLPVKVYAIGQHAEVEESLTAVIEDNFDPILARTNLADDMALGAASACIAMAGHLRTMVQRPKMIVLLGDRYEILGAALAAAMYQVPIAHIGGGDRTDGSIDNKLRYAITAISDLHFTTTAGAQKRVYDSLPQLEGNFEHEIYHVGNPALDRIHDRESVPRETLFRMLGIVASEKNILIAYHSATKDFQPWVECQIMLDVLDEFDASFLLLGTNSDHGSSHIHKQFEEFASRNPVRRTIKANLSPAMFYGALDHFSCMIGNSSAGLVETATFGIPVINVGNRQDGRPSPFNVRTYKGTAASIRAGVEMALALPREPQKNPYGDGRSAQRIARVITQYLENP